MKPKDMGHSVFNMDHVNQVAAMTNLAEAKKFALDILNNSTANTSNKAKIKKGYIVVFAKDRPAYSIKEVSEEEIKGSFKNVKVAKLFLRGFFKK
jgi:fructosamine-3-kinase